MPCARPGIPWASVGIITAFNFPVAVWSPGTRPWRWSAAIPWSGSPRRRRRSRLSPSARSGATRGAALRRRARAGLLQIVIGGRDVGEALVDSPDVPVVSATGSTRMGRAVAPKLAARFARAILELGGNNGMIVAPSADLELALRAIVFSAVGTAGQRCTSLRRLIVQEQVYDRLIPRLIAAYQGLPIGDPLAQACSSDRSSTARPSSP